MVTEVDMSKPKHGWDDEHARYTCSDGIHDSFWITVTSSPEWAAWEREVARRLKYLARHDDEVYRAEITGRPKPELSRHRNLAVFDVDECKEAGWISAEHFAEFLKFCRTKRGQRASQTRKK